MVADVDAVDFVAFGIADVTIEGTEAESEGTYEEIIEEVDVGGEHCRSAKPPCPPGQVLQQTNKDIRTPVGHWACAASGCRFLMYRPLLGHYLAFSSASVIVGWSQTSVGPQYWMGPG